MCNILHSVVSALATCLNAHEITFSAFIPQNITCYNTLMIFIPYFVWTTFLNQRFHYYFLSETTQSLNPCHYLYRRELGLSLIHSPIARPNTRHFLIFTFASIYIIQYFSLLVFHQMIHKIYNRLSCFQTHRIPFLCARSDRKLETRP